MTLGTETAEAPRLTVPNLISANERERLDAVRRYEILDTPPDGAFDRITALAARIFDVPISIVSIVDSDRIWFKSRRGSAWTRSGGTQAFAPPPSSSTSPGS
jgi:hypothetical protein